MRGGAAVCAIFRRRSRSARFAAVPPPGRLDVPNYSGAGFLPRLFFLTAARKTGAAAVFGVVGGCLRNLSAALSLRSVRRRVLCRALHRVLRRSFRVPDFAPDFYAGRAPELLIFL